MQEVDEIGFQKKGSGTKEYDNESIIERKVTRTTVRRIKIIRKKMKNKKTIKDSCSEICPTP